MDKFEKNYNIGRNISKLVFNTTLHPTVINEEVIPESGPLLICGNHLHVWDQFPVMCATKRAIHWMAKKEYFDGKMGGVFKFMGCIPVDRFGDSHKSKEEALTYLSEGSAIGLFPEGTRNKYQVAKIEFQKAKCELEEFYILLSKNKISPHIAKEQLIHYQQNIDIAFSKINKAKKELNDKNILFDENEELLPFKFGAVSMAQKTNATIVPFGVNGDYKIGNDNLVIRFGEPFKVGDRTLEEANNELRGKVLELVKENNNYSKKQ